MYAEYGKPERPLPAPWHSLHHKSIEVFFRRISRDQGILSELLKIIFPGIDFEYDAETKNLKREFYIAAYIALVIHWCCQRQCEVAIKTLTDMNPVDQNIVRLILRKVVGNEKELT